MTNVNIGKRVFLGSWDYPRTSVQRCLNYGMENLKFGRYFTTHSKENGEVTLS